MTLADVRIISGFLGFVVAYLLVNWITGGTFTVGIVIQAVVGGAAFALVWYAVNRWRQRRAGEHPGSNC